MNKPTQIYIDDGGGVHVSYRCEVCSEWTHVDDHCGDTRPDGTDEYMCGDCYGKKRADQKYIHDWLIFLDEDNPLDVGIAIHKDVIDPNCINAADHSMPEPPDDMSWYGPGTLAHVVGTFADMHMNANEVWLLVDEGFITWEGGTKIFKSSTKNPAQTIENMLYWLRHAYELFDDFEDQDTLEKVIEEGEQLLKGGAK